MFRIKIYDSYKIHILLVGSIIFSTSLHSQILSELRPISGPSYDRVFDMQRDSKGNTYLCVEINSFIQPDESVNLLDQTLEISGGNYIVKLNVKNEIEWIKSYARIEAINIDVNNNLIVAGTLNQYLFYLAKINSSGEVIWSVTEGTSGGADDLVLISDAGGDIYVTGIVNSWYFYGLQLHTASCCLDHDFLLKFDTNGVFSWVRASQSNSISAGKALAISNTGNVILGGTYYFNIQFGSHSVSNPFNQRNSYLVSFDRNGSVLWLNQLSSPNGSITLNDLAVSSSDNIFVCGSTYGTVDFGIGDPYISSGGYDFFTAKLSSTGEALWAKSGGSVGNDELDNILILDDGIIVTGNVRGNFAFNDTFYGNIPSNKALVIQIDENGNTNWLKDFGFLPEDDFGHKQGYLLNEVSPGQYAVSGIFVNSLSSQYRTLNALLHDAFVATIFMECADVQAITIDSDSTVTLCGDDTYAYVNSNYAEYHFWVALNGKPKIKTIGQQTTFSDLEYGETTFEHHVANCESHASHLFTITRSAVPKMPLSETNPKFCTNDIKNAEINIDGQSVNWYRDPSLEKKIKNGNSYNPTKSETVFVTETINGCQSDPLEITITVNNSPPPPAIGPLNICANMNSLITSNDVNSNWYLQIDDEAPIQRGSQFEFNRSVEGPYSLFISSERDGCQSIRSEIEILVSHFNIDELGLTNVITPNNDGKNDTFSIRGNFEPCLGKFLGVSIYSRSGRQVFHSLDENFAWKAEQLPTGVYFYHLSFVNQNFRNTISIIR